MSKAKKNNNLMMSRSTIDLPGPGSYSTNKNFGNDARKAQITGKPAESQRNDSPGPGKYDIKDAIVKYTTPNYGLGTTRR